MKYVMGRQSRDTTRIAPQMPASAAMKLSKVASILKIIARRKREMGNATNGVSGVLYGEFLMNICMTANPRYITETAATEAVAAPARLTWIGKKKTTRPTRKRKTDA